MSTATTQKLHTETAAPAAPVISAPVAPVAPAPKVTNDDSIPAGQATNEDARLMVEATKRAGEFDREFGALLDVFTTSVEDVVAKIIAADTVGTVHPKKTVWEVLGNTSLSTWVKTALDGKLKGWDQAGRDALLRLLVSKGFSLTDAARMTGASKATATRTMQKVRAAEEKAAGKPAATAKPAEPSTPLSRLSKSADRIADKVTDVEEYPSANMVTAALDAIRLADKMADELYRRGHKSHAEKIVSALQASGQKERAHAQGTAPRSGAQGTTGTGVNTAPKPGK